MGKWDEDFRNVLIANNGSVQNIKDLPDDFKLLYRTVWEISQKSLINLARARSPYICQS